MQQLRFGLTTTERGFGGSPRLRLRRTRRGRLLTLAVIYDGGRRSDAAALGGVGLQVIRGWLLRVAPGAHTVVMLDQAGWHMSTKLAVPQNMTQLPLPPRAPELNPVENVWWFVRDNWLSNRVFKSYDDIVDHRCQAWNNLINQRWKIMSIGKRIKVALADTASQEMPDDLGILGIGFVPAVV